MKENKMESEGGEQTARPWWAVRLTLLVALVGLVLVLVALLAEPSLLDRGFTLAGL